MEKDDSENEGLVLEGPLPAFFRVIDKFPHDNGLAYINAKNEHILKLSLMPSESADLDEHDEATIQLRRHELKIDLLIEMVGELVAKQNDIPSDVDVTLTTESIGWASASQACNPGDKLEIDLFIALPIPRALKVFGEAASSTEEGRNIANIVGMNTAVSNLLEKIIFRNHRRAIALIRTQI